MDLNEIIALSKEENDTADRKEGIGDAAGRAMAAMATSTGGKILIGITDKKVLVGLDYNDSQKNKLRMVLDKCEPKIKVKLFQIPFEKEKSILCLDVSESERKPVYFDGKPYHRKNGESIVCTNPEVLDYQVKTSQIHFDQLVAKNKDRKALLQDIDSSKMTEFINLSKEERKRTIREDVPLEDMLFNLGLYDKKNNDLNNAAVLLFSNKPQDFVPNSSISFSVFKDQNINSAPFIKQTIGGTILTMIENSINLIKLYAPPVSRIKGIKRIDVFPYPYGVLREIVTNAIVHKDYFIDSEVTIRLFSNRIEITNPGGVPHGIDFEKLIEGKNNISVPRNRLIATALDYAGQMDKAGHGFIRVLTTLQKDGFPKPQFPRSENSFQAIIFAGDTSSGLQKSTDLNYKKGKKKVLSTILKSDSIGISTKELCKKTDYTNVHISNITKELEEEMQIIKRRKKKEMFYFPKT
ncbi:MAG TPA: ATP-binding protein [archaeon]|nr:ATP-binding protein [archaeon]